VNLTGEQVIGILAELGAGVLWTLVIIAAFFFVVSSRSDKE